MSLHESLVTSRSTFPRPFPRAVIHGFNRLVTSTCVLPFENGPTRTVLASDPRLKLYTHYKRKFMASWRTMWDTVSGMTLMSQKRLLVQKNAADRGIIFSMILGRSRADVYFTLKLEVMHKSEMQNQGPLSHTWSIEVMTDKFVLKLKIWFNLGKY